MWCLLLVSTGVYSEPGQVQQGSKESSGEGFGKPWCKAKSGSTGSVEGSGEGLGGFGADKVLEKVWEALVQSQVEFNRVPEEVPKKVWEALEHAEVFPGLGFAARFRKICRKKRCGCWGYQRSLFPHGCYNLVFITLILFR